MAINRPFDLKVGDIITGYGPVNGADPVDENYYKCNKYRVTEIYHHIFICEAVSKNVTDIVKRKCFRKCDYTNGFVNRA